MKTKEFIKKVLEQGKRYGSCVMTQLLPTNTRMGGGILGAYKAAGMVVRFTFAITRLLMFTATAIEVYSMS